MVRMTGCSLSSVPAPSTARNLPWSTPSRLKEIAEELSDRLLIVMRVYFEKPRTTVGWKGLIYDPHLNDTFDIEAGLRTARSLLLEISEMGMYAGTEFLDPVVPQYLAGLVTWGTIGARTTESQIHRQMASGLSMPVGFKNGTDGNAQIAVDAMLSARSPHGFFGHGRRWPDRPHPHHRQPPTGTWCSGAAMRAPILAPEAIAEGQGPPGEGRRPFPAHG